MSVHKAALVNVSLSDESDSGVNERLPNMSLHDDKMLSSGNSSLSLDDELNADEEEEKKRLITQVLELQNTLDALSKRVDSVKEENLKLRSENQVLGQYIENLMAASSVFQSTSPKTKKKSGNKKKMEK